MATTTTSEIRRIRPVRQLGGRIPWFTGGWPVRSLAIDPRERFVLVTGEDGIRLFHAATGEIERSFEPKPMGVSTEEIGFREDGSVAFARIGKFHGPHSWGVWDVETGAFLREFGDPEFCHALDSSGTRAIASNNDGITVWDLVGERVIRSIAKERGGYGSSAFLGRSDRAIVSIFGRSCMLWDFGSGAIVWERELGPTHSEVASVAAPEEGDWFAVGDGNRCVHVHDVATGERRFTLGKPEARPYGTVVGSLSVSRDGSRIAAMSGTWLFVFDVAKKEVLLQENILPYDNQPLCRIAPSGTWVVTGGRTGSLQRFELGGGLQPKHELLVHEKRIRRCAFGPNGEIYSTDGFLTLAWDADGRSRRVGLEDGPEELRVDAAKPRYVSAQRPPWIAGLQGAIEGEVYRQDRSAHAPVVGPTIAANIMQDGEVMVWDLSVSQEPIAMLVTGTSTMDTFPSRAWEISVHPDGRRIAVATNNGDAPVQLWDGRTGKMIAICEGHEAPATWVTFSADGKLLASSSMDRTVRVFALDEA